ncbi:hypothetical protein LCGC14_0382390 [marine sediment metagenome]|uniref:Uncharacterized protein n=1 Tax=marine sediment metagenome TaxID=412755 RepID=A0A0F9T1Q0_9ZZZZ
MTKYQFPWPPKELSPNARVHWRALAQAKARYAEDCGWNVKAQIGHSMAFALNRRRFPIKPPVQAQVTFVVTDKRRRDSDNHMAMLKPLWDALVETGVLEDDSHDKLKIAEPKWERGPEKKVIVELSPYRNGGE